MTASKATLAQALQTLQRRHQRSHEHEDHLAEFWARQAAAGQGRQDGAATALQGRRRPR